MKEEKNTRTKRAFLSKHSAQTSNQTRPVLYNDYYVQEVTMLAIEGFAARLYSLRSARKLYRHVAQVQLRSLPRSIHMMFT